MIDFESRESHLLLNPALPPVERTRLESLYASVELPGHVFLATSGSSGSAKLVALSKRAILVSAEAVNGRLESDDGDLWCSVLPTFHVAGLGIHARAHLSGAGVQSMKWDPRAFAGTSATLASLVPAQVFDLVALGMAPPPRLRAVLVGGGVFDPELDARARALGWPVLASYGMSECASTVSILDEILAHLDARVDSDGRLAFRGASLFTGYVNVEGLTDPKVDGWFSSQDRGAVAGRSLKVFGRGDEFVKIGGESVNLMRLDQIAAEVAREVGGDAGVVAVVDARLGRVIHLAVTNLEIAGRFQERVLPFERARRVHLVEVIPRSALGKLLRAALYEQIELRGGSAR